MSDGIVHERGETKGRYALRIGGAEAELVYSIASPTLIIAEHTEVPDSMRGTGAGRRLAERLVADALAGGWKIIPLCPFVNAERRKHPDWAGAFTV